jgi:hypothetical protein
VADQGNVLIRKGKGVPRPFQTIAVTEALQHSAELERWLSDLLEVSSKDLVEALSPRDLEVLKKRIDNAQELRLRLYNKWSLGRSGISVEG